MQKDEKIFVPIPEDQREKLTELLKAYQPQRNARKEIETLTAKYLNQTFGDVNLTQDEYLKKVEKICNKYKNKRLSPRKGKTFPTEITYQVMDMLEVYWANDLPENENRKSWFHKIADENAMTFSNVAEIERKYRPPKFTPKR